jgi:hypothetical protein
MEPVLFVMAILGCGEGDAPCRQVATVQARYRSEAACLAATGAELSRRSDILYPSVVAQCRRADTRPQLIRGSDVMLPAGGSPPVQPRYASAGRRAQPGT